MDFGSRTNVFHLHDLAMMDPSYDMVVEEMFKALSGGLVHGLLEWSAVMMAGFTTILALTHYAINKDATTPILGVALFCSGVMDAFHTLAATRLIEAVADNRSFIPFTWALSRTFNAVIMMIGVLICLRLRTTRSRAGVFQISLVSLIFAAASYGLITYAAGNADLPQTQFPDLFITRPYDVLPLVLFLIAIPIFWRFYRGSPNMLSAALLITLVPEIVLEAHMAFGSQALFDNHFNIAHFLKVLAYMVPTIGLLSDYLATYRSQAETSLQLAQGQQRLKAVMDTVVDGIITSDGRGRIENCNPAACNIFGYPFAEMVGGHVRTLMAHPSGEEYEQTQLNPLHYYDPAMHKGCRELTGKRKDGSTFPIEVSFGEMNCAGEILYSWLVRDISARKHAEAALRATNEELERFAYIASHDLKAPLRVIDNASKWLEEDLAEQLTGENRENMDLMRGRVRRMEKLLDDLLEYSRVGRRTDDRYCEYVNGAALMSEIVDLLNPPDGFTIHVSPAFAAIHVPRMPLQQILLNLVNNALKHHDKPQGRIDLGVTDTDDHYEFHVRDDGPGIHPDFHEQIFEMFQTLKPRDQVEGSGMGLAMVKKHLDLAGGTIHLQSIEGQGSTFTIFWPKQHVNEGQPV